MVTLTSIRKEHSEGLCLRCPAVTVPGHLRETHLERALPTLPLQQAQGCACNAAHSVLYLCVQAYLLFVFALLDFPCLVDCLSCDCSVSIWCHIYVRLCSFKDSCAHIHSS